MSTNIECLEKMIIFLYGEDEFRSKRKLAEIKNKFTEKNKEGGTLFVFDFEENKTEPEEVIVNLSSGNLFSEHKLMILKSALQDESMRGSEDFIRHLKKDIKPEASATNIVFWEKEKFEKKTRLAKYLLGNGRCQEFRYLSGAKYLTWLKDEVNNKSASRTSISAEALERLAAYLSPKDLSLAEKEIEKLINFRSKGEIVSSDSDLLVKSQINTDIFKTIDALSGGEKQSALRYLHDHLNSGDDPFYLLSMYIFQFRNLLKVKPLSAKNYASKEIATKLKIHPFVAKKSAEQGRKFTLRELKNLYKKLCMIDFHSKTGRVDITLALDKFIAEV